MLKRLEIWLLKLRIWHASAYVGEKVCKCGYPESEHYIVDVAYPEGLCFQFKDSGRKYSIYKLKRELKSLERKADGH